MHSSVEAQLATAWDMATDQIQAQAKHISALQAQLGDEAGSRARMALAKEAAEIQIGMNALAEVRTMLDEPESDLAGIRERLDRVGALLGGLHEQATAKPVPTEESSSASEQADAPVTLASRAQAGRKR